ncbi:ABC transporter permease [Pacificoceanicola onchidii]|uniref:ABC transporter permease n=1 Tax=Pacificoceanicola onchidii TaxID=2562685 RepID=UPI0010A689DE|nr:ABC transporter permease [Pacificoceanicola onchidii]
MENKTLGQKASYIFFEYNALVMLVVLVVASSFLSEAFLSTQNITNLLRQLIPLLLVSIGMLLVILTGGIDLAVGSVAAVGGVVLVMVMNGNADGGAFWLILSVLAAAGGGALLGAVTGAFVAFFRMAPFVASLALMTIARGIAYIISNGQPQRFDREQEAALILRTFGSKSAPIIDLAWPIVFGALVIAFFYVLMRYTAYGRLTVATGSNETAIRLAGIPVARYKLLAYAACGALSAIAGVVVASRSGVATPASGVALELDAIAACVIGGALLSGGKGTVVNTVIGVLVLGLIGNIMNLLSVPAYPQQVIKGAIIILAVLLQGVGRKDARV